MSQRGLLRCGATDKTSTRWWTHIRIALALAMALLLGATLTVLAQDIETSKVVTLLLDGSVRQVATSKETVQTLLHQERIVLGRHDRCEPALTDPVVNGMTIKVVRVTCERVTRTVEIPTPVVTRLDARLYDSQTFELRQGSPGLVKETVVVWKKDGEVSAQWVEKKQVVRHSQPTVILRGTMPSTSRSGMKIRRVLTMESTAYDPGPLSCGPHSNGRTANGMKAQKGVVAVDPRVIPLGTRVFVDGYGPAIAADTGGAIKGNRIDVCFNTRREALNWGRRQVQVMILE